MREEDHDRKGAPAGEPLTRGPSSEVVRRVRNLRVPRVSAGSGAYGKHQRLLDFHVWFRIGDP